MTIPLFLQRLFSAVLLAGLAAAGALHYLPLHGAAFASALAGAGAVAAMAALLAPRFPAIGNPAAGTSNDWKPAAPTWLVLAVCFAAAFAMAGTLLSGGRILAQLTDAYPQLQLRALLVTAGAGLVGVLASRMQIGTVTGRFAAAQWMLAAATLACAPLLPRAYEFAFLPVAFFAGLLLALAQSLGRALPVAFCAGAGVAAGVAITGFVLFPRLHYTPSLYAGAVVVALLFATSIAVLRLRLLLFAAGLGLLGVAGFALPGRVAPILSPTAGWTVAAQREGLAGAVTLLEKPVQPGQPLLQRLVVDNRHVIGGELGFGEKRLGHLPLLLAPEAKRVLFVGVNAGVAMGAARSYTGLEHIDGIEASPDVVALLQQFAVSNDQLAEEPRVKIVCGLPTRILAASASQYDVIVAGPTTPAREGSAWVLSRECFMALRDRLAAGGLVAQWLPLHQTDAEELKQVVRTFLAVFPEARGYIGIYNGELPVLGLFARKAGPLPAFGTIEKALLNNGRAHSFVADMADLLASQFLDAKTLHAFAGEGPLNAGRFPALLLSRGGGPHGGELLQVLLAGAVAPQTDWIAPGPEMEAARPTVGLRATAVRNYLAADILRAGGDAKREREMIRLYLAAYDAEPAFAPAKGMLLLQTLQKPHLSVQAFEGMIARTPGDDQLRKLFIQVQRKHGESQGLPMPPAAAGMPRLPMPPGPPSPR